MGNICIQKAKDNMTCVTKIINYINNNYWTDSSLFTLFFFAFLTGVLMFGIGNDVRKQELLPLNEIEITANKIELVSNVTGSGRSDSNSIRIYIDNEPFHRYYSPCSGKIPPSFCGKNKRTIVQNAKLKFMAVLVKNKYSQNKSYDGHIISLSDVNGNLLINDDISSVKYSREGIVRRYFFWLFAVFTSFVVFLVLLVRIFNKLMKGW